MNCAPRVARNTLALAFVGLGAPAFVLLSFGSDSPTTALSAPPHHTPSLDPAAQGLAQSANRASDDAISRTHKNDPAVKEPISVMAVSNLPPRRFSWVVDTRKTSLIRVVDKLQRLEDPMETPDRYIEYLILHRQVAVLHAQLRLLDNDEALVANGEPPARLNHLRIQEFSFSNGIAALANGTRLTSARIVYDIDLDEHSDIALLDREISNARQSNNAEACRQFNARPDTDRQGIYQRWAELRVQFQAAHRAIQGLVSTSPEFSAQYAQLSADSRRVWKAMNDLLPFDVHVHPRTWIATIRH